MQKEADELLANGAIEASPGGTGFYSNVFMISGCRGALCPVLNLKQFNHYINIPTIRQGMLSYSAGYYAFSIDLKNAYLHIPLVWHHHLFYFV